MSFLLALSFLSSIPVSLGRIMSNEEMGWSTRWFPAVGAVIGGIVASVFVLVGRFVPSPVAGAIALTVWMVLTRGLHLDGLADTFDGLGGGFTRDRALEIMRDSRIGTFGALAIGAVLILKFSALSSFGFQGYSWIVVAPVLARWGMVLAIFFFPPARKDGAGRVFISYCRLPELSIASCFALVVSTTFLGWVGIVIFGLSGLVSYVLGVRISSHLKGLTGDSYGCICEITEVFVLLAGSVLVSW